MSVPFVPSKSSAAVSVFESDTDTELAWPPPDDPRFAVDVMDLQTRRVLTVQEAAREVAASDVSVDEALHTAADTSRPLMLRESWPVPPAPLPASGTEPPSRPHSTSRIRGLSAPVLVRALIALVVVQAIAIAAFLVRGRSPREPVAGAKSPTAAQSLTRATPPPSAAVPTPAAVPHPVDTTAAALPARPIATGGRLLVRSDPLGAVVAIDGLRRGTAPLTVEDLAAGSHRVQISTAGASIEQKVTIEAGTTTSLVVPIQSAAVASAWVNVGAPIDVQIFENGLLIGTSADGPLRLSAGTHKLQLVNESLGYRGEQEFTVRAGEMARLRPSIPDGVLHVNAQPWANVWVDGEPVGETPLANVKVSVGRHEIRFRHPSFGEQVRQVVVSTSEPVRISVNMKP
jgi:PEGA domain